MKQTETIELTTASWQRTDALRASLVSIVEVCPIGICDSEECPLYAFRTLSHTERVRKFDALDGEDLVQLAAFHHSYLNFKLSQGPGKEHPPATA